MEIWHFASESFIKSLVRKSWLSHITSVQWYTVSGAFKDETDKREKNFHHAKYKLQIFMASLKWNFSNTDYLFLLSFPLLVHHYHIFCICTKFLTQLSIVLIVLTVEWTLKASTETFFQKPHLTYQQKLILSPKAHHLSLAIRDTGQRTENPFVFELQHSHAQ